MPIIDSVISIVLATRLVKVILPIIVGRYNEIYECYHRQTKQLRAVKIIPRDSIEKTIEERFMREIEVLKVMDHPNIVKLYETYCDTKRMYLVME